MSSLSPSFQYDYGATFHPLSFSSQSTREKMENLMLGRWPMPLDDDYNRMCCYLNRSSPESGVDDAERRMPTVPNADDPNC